MAFLHVFKHHHYRSELDAPNSRPGEHCLLAVNMLWTEIFPSWSCAGEKTQKIHRNTTSPYLLSWMHPRRHLWLVKLNEVPSEKTITSHLKMEFLLEDKLFLLKTWLFFSGNQTNFYKFQFVTSAVLKGQVLKMFFSKWTARSPTRRLSKRTPTASKPTPYHPCMVYFTYIYHKNQPNVGKYTIHGLYGNGFQNDSINPKDEWKDLTDFLDCQDFLGNLGKQCIWTRWRKEWLLVVLFFNVGESEVFSTGKIKSTRGNPVVRDGWKSFYPGSFWGAGPFQWGVTRGVSPVWRQNSKIDHDDLKNPVGIYIYIYIYIDNSERHRMPSARHQLKPKSQRFQNKVQWTLHASIFFSSLQL